jgi:hypothetical protein
MDARFKEQHHFERAFPQALILMTRPCSHHRINSTALLPEFGGMGVGATDFIRLLMRKLTLDRIRVRLRRDVWTHNFDMTPKSCRRLHAVWHAPRQFERGSILADD